MVIVLLLSEAHFGFMPLGQFLDNCFALYNYIEQFFSMYRLCNMVQLNKLNLVIFIGFDLSVSTNINISIFLSP